MALFRPKTLLWEDELCLYPATLLILYLDGSSSLPSHIRSSAADVQLACQKMWGSSPATEEGYNDYSDQIA